MRYVELIITFHSDTKHDHLIYRLMNEANRTGGRDNGAWGRCEGPSQ